MKDGILVYDMNEERYRVRYGLEEYSDGLHCGHGFEVEINGAWKPTRIEMSDEWYLVSISRQTGLQGLKVRGNF